MNLFFTINLSVQFPNPLSTGNYPSCWEKGGSLRAVWLRKPLSWHLWMRWVVSRDGSLFQLFQKLSFSTSTTGAWAALAVPQPLALLLWLDAFGNIIPGCAQHLGQPRELRRLRLSNIQVQCTEHWLYTLLQ